jgi:hypothetical protein
MTCRPLDPLRIPIRLTHLLHYFDGRPTSEATEATEREHNLKLTPSLIWKLVDYEILAPG